VPNIKVITAAFLCAASLNCYGAAYANGSFESLSLADGQQRLITNTSPRTTLEGWTVTCRVVVRDPLTGETTQPTDGQNFIYLDNGATIAQTFDTVAGEAYSVSYDFSKTRGEASLLIDGQVHDRLPGDREPMQGAIGFYFVAVGTTTTISFVAPPDQHNGGIGRLALDHVVVEPSNVPEPAASVMLAAGLLVLGGLASRRRAG